MRKGGARAIALAALAALCAVTVPSTAAAVETSAQATRDTAASARSEPSVTPSRAAELVGDMTTLEQATSIIMGHVPSADPAILRDYMTQGLGGFILMGANLAPGADPRALTSALVIDPEVPPLIAIDQEGGIVSRLEADGYASSTTLKDLPTDATISAFAARGSLVAQQGITVNFGTVADTTPDPASFIFGRALGADPQTAADRVAGATGAQEQFVASTLKHFPGHGAASGDSHHAIPRTEKTLDAWRATDAVPFIAGIDAGASLLMFGHLAYPAVDQAPASLSPRWHEIARDELGFDGVIVSDDLGMLQSSGIPEYADPVANAAAAVAAGTDLVLMIAGSTSETAAELAAGIAAAVDSGALPQERLADAATRVMELRLKTTTADATGWMLCPDCAPAT